jgi:hypothetical protein
LHTEVFGRDGRTQQIAVFEQESPVALIVYRLTVIHRDKSRIAAQLRCNLFRYCCMRFGIRTLYPYQDEPGYETVA